MVLATLREHFADRVDFSNDWIFIERLSHSQKLLRRDDQGAKYPMSVNNR